VTGAGTDCTYNFNHTEDGSNWTRDLWNSNAPLCYGYHSDLSLRMCLVRALGHPIIIIIMMSRDKWLYTGFGLIIGFTGHLTHNSWLLGNFFQQRTFPRYRAHVLAGWRPPHTNLLLCSLPSQDTLVTATGPGHISWARTAQKTPFPLLRVFSRCRGNKLFASNGCWTVACLHSCYLAIGLHATIIINNNNNNNTKSASVVANTWRREKEQFRYCRVCRLCFT
jgi:hypothetical protein